MPISVHVILYIYFIFWFEQLFSQFIYPVLCVMLYGICPSWLAQQLQQPKLKRRSATITKREEAKKQKRKALPRSCAHQQIQNDGRWNVNIIGLIYVIIKFVYIYTVISVLCVQSQNYLIIP